MASPSLVYDTRLIEQGREIEALLIEKEFFHGAAGVVRALTNALVYESQRLVCSWCGNDFEPGDWSSTGCCNCDPVPASSLPNLLKEARREARETMDEWAKEQDERSDLRSGTRGP